MEIKTTIVDQVFIIQLSGKIDFESIKNFRLLCAKDWVGQRVLFDFEQLSFVGSSGITYLIESIENLQKIGDAIIGFCRPRSEFHRIFEVGSLKTVPIFQDRKSGVYALSQTERNLMAEAIVPNKPIEIN